MQPPRLIPVEPFFNLTLGFNEGAGSGMFGGLRQGRPWAMIALTGFISAQIGVWALRAKPKLERLVLGLIFGGALGNIIDRIRQGAATDILDFHWKDWRWPMFNMADVTIFIGTMLSMSAALPLQGSTAIPAARSGLHSARVRTGSA